MLPKLMIMTIQEKLTDVENILRVFDFLNKKHTREVGVDQELDCIFKERNIVHHWRAISGSFESTQKV